MSVQTAAIQVLKEAGKPLHATEIAKLIIEAGLWKSDGKTPEAYQCVQVFVFWPLLVVRVMPIRRGVFWLWRRFITAAAAPRRRRWATLVCRLCGIGFWPSMPVALPG